MTRLRFKHFEAFQAVIATGSASAAARQMMLSQPAVSKIIRQAEHLLGFTLFDRRHGRLVPTERALVLYEQIVPLFTTLERMNDICDRMAQGRLAPIAIGVVPLLAATLLPSVIRRTLEQDYSVAVHTQDSVVLTNRVAAGQVEFALVSAMHSFDGVESAPLARSPTFIAVPADHRLAGAKTVHVSDLAEEPYISLSTTEAIQTRLDQLFQAHEVRPREVVRSPFMAGAIAMAEQGIGLTLADAFAMQLARLDKLRFIPFQPEFWIDYRAIWPRGRVSTFNRKLLLSNCQRRAAEIVAAASGGSGLASQTMRS